MPGGFSDTGPVTYATSGVSSTTATRKVESTVEVVATPAASSVQFDTTGLDSSMDEYYAEYDSLTAFYGMDYATEFGSYSSYYTA